MHIFPSRTGGLGEDLTANVFATLAVILQFWQPLVLMVTFSSGTSASLAQFAFLAAVLSSQSSFPSTSLVEADNKDSIFSLFPTAPRRRDTMRTPLLPGHSLVTSSTQSTAS